MWVTHVGALYTELVEVSWPVRWGHYVAWALVWVC